MNMEIRICSLTQQVVVTVSLLDLTKIKPGFISNKHPFVGKWVTLKMQGATADRELKGREAFVHRHNWIKNTFVVNVGAFSQPTVHTTTIWHK